MIIETNTGERIDCQDAPEWNDFHQQYYVTGKRWVKSRKTWTKSAARYNFKTYKEVGA